MEEQIKTIVRILKIPFYTLWIVSALLLLSFELEWIPTGWFAGSEVVEYWLQTAGILVAIAGIPGSLKLFSWMLVHKINRENLEEALDTYRKISIVRLSILELVVMFNWIVYYFTLNNAGLLCALIALIATLFCVPSEQKLRADLQID